VTFTRETDDDDWVGAISIRGESYPFTLRVSYEPDELDAVAARATAFLESNWQRILDQTTGDLLPMYNSEWRDEDAPPLTEAAFRTALGAPEINVWEEEAIMIYFANTDLFAGHLIEVFIEGPESDRRISVGIMG
jgi:hypothetical protein